VQPQQNTHAKSTGLSQDEHLSIGPALIPVLV